MHSGPIRPVRQTDTTTPNIVVRSMEMDATCWGYASPDTQQKKCWDLFVENLIKLYATTSNKSQDVQTCSANGHNMLRPTMLRPFMWRFTTATPNEMTCNQSAGTYLQKL